MPKDKKKNLQLTDKELIALGSIIGGLVEEGGLNERDHPFDMCELFAEVYARITKMAAASIMGKELDTKLLVGSTMIGLADRFKNDDEYIESDWGGSKE